MREPLSPDEFEAWNKKAWSKAIANAFPNGKPTSATFTDVSEIIRILDSFSDNNLNHTLLPRGGGMDFEVVTEGREEGTIELHPDPGCAYVCRPASLYWEYFPQSEVDSFLLLETNPLEPSGVYQGNRKDGYEEVLEMPDGCYADRDTRDLGEDESGRTIPLPRERRHLVRFFKGKFIVVAKKSLWNKIPETYDGQHNQLSAKEIRSIIQEGLDRFGF